MTQGQSDKEPFYITTAISYVNGPPHLGHAYEAISTDVIARFKRLDGFDVMFLTGTDEHGQKVEKTAREAGKDPKAFSDEIAALFKEMVAELNISNDAFIRTTEPRHYEASQGIWRKLEENGDIYLDKYEGWYSIRDEAFYDESELTKDEDGTFRAPTGTEVDWVEEDSYFFRLSAYQEPLLAHYDANPDFIRPEFRRNEVVSFVKQGLRDLSISRTNFDWGVPVPGDPNHVMYVWLDALTNYITAVGYPDENAPLYKRYWPADVHIIGKDIVRFHAVYWPAFLLSAGVPLPKCVFGHGFLTIGGEKMSKSLGNVVTSQTLIEEFGLDPVRYFLIREVPFGNDGTISHEAINHRIDGDLANDIGNLAQRVLTMINRNCEGQVPWPSDLSDDDFKLLSAARELLPIMRSEMENFALHKVLETIWRVVSDANRYVDHQAPWALRKSDEARMGTVLYVCADVLRQLAICIQPVMPDAAMKLLDQLSVSESARTFADLEAGLEPKTKLPPPEPIFPSKALRFERGVYVSLKEGLVPFNVDRIFRDLRLRSDNKSSLPELDYLVLSDDIVFVIEVKVPRRPHEIMNAAQQLKMWIKWAKSSGEVLELNNAREIVPIIIVPYDTEFSGEMQGVPVLKFNMSRREYERPELFDHRVREYFQLSAEDNPRS